MQRSSGILLHPTALPGPMPIGDIGPVAYEWIDWLAAAGARWWQVLPINPPGFAGSPYQAFSAFAGNPALISPELMLEDGLVDRLPELAAPTDRIDFEQVEQFKRSLVTQAVDRVRTQPEFEEFERREARWLDDYAIFMAIKRSIGGAGLAAWPQRLRRFRSDAVAEAGLHLAADVEAEKVAQFIFFDQWRRLRAHATEHDIGLIGDAPFYVAADSADVWMRPELFDLDEEGNPRTVAGVPPDYFSETGQLWGNPQYRWSEHAANGFEWWISRLGSLLGQVDLIRIDHFRAFADYWQIPAGSPTAEHGRWVDGPGMPLFEAVRAALGGLPLIAEDLGELHDVVPALRDAVGLPGMEVAHFAFGAQPSPPASWPERSIGYTGTHDNDTTAGWWASLGPQQRDRARRLGGIGDQAPTLDLIESVWRSPCMAAVTPVQDLLQLGSEARMNTPGTVGPHNWTWRLDNLPSAEDAAWLRSLNRTTRR